MIRTIADFDATWQKELEATQKIFKHLTTASLSTVIHKDVRTPGRLAWHIVTSIPEMAHRTGITTAGPGADAPIPATAKEIFDAFSTAGISLLEQVKRNWTDASLSIEDDMYGEKWARGITLQILIQHQIHHRGQLTVLMRLAGLSIPGIYGPAFQEWSAYGMEPPAI